MPSGRLFNTSDFNFFLTAQGEPTFSLDWPSASNPVKGKPRSDAEQLVQEFRDMATGKLDAAERKAMSAEDKEKLSKAGLAPRKKKENKDSRDRVGKLQEQAKNTERLIELAVKGMLPKGPLGRRMARKLKVYAGAEHPHAAQCPRPLVVAAAAR